MLDVNCNFYEHYNTSIGYLKLAKMKRTFVISLIFIASCVAPSQPPLTKKEKAFITEIEKLYNGKTERSIGALLLAEPNSNHKGSYSLNTQVNCDFLQTLGKDSSKIEKDAYLIAKKLFAEVLDRDIKYNKIWVSFSCDTSNYLYKDLIYVYSVDSL